MFYYLDIVSAVLIGVVILVGVIFRKRAYVLDRRYFQRHWNKVQKQCSDKKMWCKAVMEADNLLDEALKRLHFKGKSTGERLVSAQRYLSSNDDVWFSHKLRNRIEEKELAKLSKQETIEALKSYRSALKDLGALGEEKLGKSGARK